jgi:hypothetical protein
MILRPGATPQVDPFHVKNPHPEKYRLAWCDPNNLLARMQQYGVSDILVPPKVAQTEYGIPKYECHGDRVTRLGVVLIRIPTEAYEAWQAANEYRALTGTIVDLAEFRNQTNRPDMLKMGDEEMALPAAPPGVYRRANPALGARRENPALDEVLAARGLTRSMIDPDSNPEDDEPDESEDANGNPEL